MRNALTVHAHRLQQRATLIHNIGAFALRKVKAKPGQLAHIVHQPGIRMHIWAGFPYTHGQCSL